MSNQFLFIADSGYHDGSRELHDPHSPGPAAFIALYPETSPEAIHAVHHRLVWAAYPKHRTPEAISDAVDLPVSIVRKHLVELGYLQPDEPRPLANKARSGQPTWSAR